MNRDTDTMRAAYDEVASETLGVHVEEIQIPFTPNEITKRAQLDKAAYVSIFQGDVDSVDGERWVHVPYDNIDALVCALMDAKRHIMNGHKVATS